MSGLFRNKLLRRITILAAILLVIFGITVYKDHKSLIESGAGATLNPVQKVIYSTNKRVESFIDFFLRYDEVKLTNKELSEENVTLSQKLRDYDALKNENLKLKEMFEISERSEQYTYQGANVIGNVGGGILTSYLIDIGEDHGLLPGMAIMTEQGIVGQITKTAKTWSTVETLSSENISIHVTTAEEHKNSGILKGYTGQGQKQMAMISYLPVDSTIKEGDQVITSGLGGFYPPDIYVGTVTKVNEDKGNLMKTAIVEPAVDFKGIELLFVIVPKNVEEGSY
ncbi:MAG: rod shape-determining protein MreC [Clostridium sp.]|nr:rod shape-determining protein MreC [Clostridium sp.]